MRADVPDGISGLRLVTCQISIHGVFFDQTR
jgi:hypothetical protein